MTINITIKITSFLWLAYIHCQELTILAAFTD